MSRKGIDFLFAPGTIYILHGEYRKEYFRYVVGRMPYQAYKVGATTKGPEARVRAARAEGWIYSENIQIVHTIDVDNARVAELMFHCRYDDRRINHDDNYAFNEWFAIGDKIAGLRRCQSLSIVPALTSLAGKYPLRPWWLSLTPPRRRDVAVALWSHRLTRIILEAR